MAQSPSLYNNWQAPYQDPYAAANQRAQARVDTGTRAYQQALSDRLAGFNSSRQRYQDDAEWLLRTGAQANFRNLQQRGGVYSGQRDRLAERLQAQVGRPLMRNLGELDTQEQQARQQTAEGIASLQGSLPVMQAEELARQYSLDASALNNAIAEAGMTGRYLPPQAKALISGVIQQKQRWEDANKAGDTAGMQAAHEEANKLRMALDTMGIDSKAISADTALTAATTNSGRMGYMTPTQRQAMINWFGIDPVSGDWTQGGRLNEQQLSRGQLENEIAANPEYGLAAQARADIALRQAQAAQQQAAAEKAKRDLASLPKATTREEILGKWGGIDLGLTTNFAALDQLLTDLAAEALAGTTTQDELDAYLMEQSRALRAQGVDPRAVRAAMARFVGQVTARNMDPTYEAGQQAYRRGERAYSDAPATGGQPQGTTVIPTQGVSFQAPQMPGVIPSYWSTPQPAAQMPPAAGVYWTPTKPYDPTKPPWAQ